MSELQEQFGENAEKFAEQLNLRQQVFNQLIDRYLLLTDADRLNMLATDLELHYALAQRVLRAAEVRVLGKDCLGFVLLVPE